ncbi:ABC transporter permease [Ruegeria atlantica]|uniref:ABC transporter permease n=1 Tax=Ruegeria atlantica TaxID=81569 RepID=UPI00147D080A|nr:ABC transporter permease [Ruegeria atlantica]
MNALAIPMRAVRQLPGLFIVGFVITFAWIAVAILAPVLAPYDPDAIAFDALLTAPSPDHLMGTDQLGRDIFSRVLYGARVDLFMGVVGLIVPLVIGVFLGLLSGYFVGWTDTIIMRALDITIAFPFLVLVLAIVAVLGPGLSSYFVALALVAWVPYARLVRGQVKLIKQTDFIAATTSLGFGSTYTLIRHVLPNCIVPALVFAVTDFVLIILYGSSLGFLGMGAQPPTAEWGVMIADGQTYLSTAWWISFFPGLALLTLGVGAALLGDGTAKLMRVER